MFTLVAPPVGAWIETITVRILNTTKNVAPPVGAWIETLGQVMKVQWIPVAPPVGAWIETWMMWIRKSKVRSLPPWERGLKH